MQLVPSCNVAWHRDGTSSVVIIRPLNVLANVIRYTGSQRSSFTKYEDDLEHESEVFGRKMITSKTEMLVCGRKGGQRTVIRDRWVNIWNKWKVWSIAVNNMWKRRERWECAGENQRKLNEVERSMLSVDWYEDVDEVECQDVSGKAIHDVRGTEDDGEKCLEVAEDRIVRKILGVALKDKIRMEEVRSKTTVTRLYGNVLRKGKCDMIMKA